MSTDTIRNENRIDNLPTSDHDVPGLTSTSHFRQSDQIRLEGRSTPIIVGSAGVRKDIIDSTTRQHALKTSHGRTDASSYELFEQINLVDDRVVQIIDIDGQPVGVFEVPQ